MSANEQEIAAIRAIIEEQTSRVVAAVNERKAQIMATLQEVKDSFAAGQDALNAAVDRVRVDFEALIAKIADLQAQIDAGTGVTAEDLAGLQADAEALKGTADALDPIPDEPAPPAPEEPPAV
jgi:ABC-type transporter Mla subunit MlaD